MLLWCGVVPGNSHTALSWTEREQSLCKRAASSALPSLIPDIWIYVALEPSYCCCPKNEKPIESSTMDTPILIARPPAAPVLPIVILPCRPRDEYTAIAEHPCGNEWLPSSFLRTDCLPFDRVYA